ncbi:hypothetical protein BC828DRAFT_382824, partial [Blastocladiella britannica]
MVRMGNDGKRERRDGKLCFNDADEIDNQHVAVLQDLVHLVIVAIPLQLLRSCCCCWLRLLDFLEGARWTAEGAAELHCRVGGRVTVAQVLVVRRHRRRHFALWLVVCILVRAQKRPLHARVVAVNGKHVAQRVLELAERLQRLDHQRHWWSRGGIGENNRYVQVKVEGKGKGREVVDTVGALEHFFFI